MNDAVKDAFNDCIQEKEWPHTWDLGHYMRCVWLELDNMTSWIVRCAVCCVLCAVCVSEHTRDPITGIVAIARNEIFGKLGMSNWEVKHQMAP